jgi:hypothetical protein
VHVDASDGIPQAWIDWEAVMSALDTGQLPSSGGEKRILRIAASLAAGHPVDLRGRVVRRGAGMRWPGLGERTCHPTLIAAHAIDLLTWDRIVR